MTSLLPNKGNKTIWGNIQAKRKKKNQKNTLCHSFCIIVIPSVILSFFPDFCHSFRIIVIPSGLVSFLPNIVIPSQLLPFKKMCHPEYVAPLHILPYLKGEKNGHRRWP